MAAELSPQLGLERVLPPHEVPRTRTGRANEGGRDVVNNVGERGRNGGLSGIQKKTRLSRGARWQQMNAPRASHLTEVTRPEMRQTHPSLPTSSSPTGASRRPCWFTHNYIHLNRLVGGANAGSPQDVAVRPQPWTIVRGHAPKTAPGAARDHHTATVGKGRKLASASSLTTAVSAPHSIHATGTHHPCCTRRARSRVGSRVGSQRRLQPLRASKNASARRWPRRRAWARRAHPRPRPRPRRL